MLENCPLSQIWTLLSQKCSRFKATPDLLAAALHHELPSQGEEFSPFPMTWSPQQHSSRNWTAHNRSATVQPPPLQALGAPKPPRRAEMSDLNYLLGEAENNPPKHALG